jgi:hypothetical protein
MKMLLTAGAIQAPSLTNFANSCGVRIANDRRDQKHMRISVAVVYLFTHRFHLHSKYCRNHGSTLAHCSGTGRAWTGYWAFAHQQAMSPCGNSKDSWAKGYCNGDPNLHSILTDDAEVFHGLAVSTIFPARRLG